MRPHVMPDRPQDTGATASASPPLVYVPGLPGSTLVEAASGRRIFFRYRDASDPRWKKELLPKLNGPEDPAADDGVVAGEPIASLFKAEQPLLDVSLGKQAASLYDVLRKQGMEPEEAVCPVAWDWRRPVDHPGTLEALRRAIAGGDGAVTVLAQGAGGLVLRSLLEAEPQLVERIAAVVCFGVPWAGTVQPLVDLAGERSFPPFDRAATRDILSHSWALFDLLPPEPAGEDAAPHLFDADGEPASPLLDTRWIARRDRAMKQRAERAAERRGRRRAAWELGGRTLRIWNLIGWGLETCCKARFDKREGLTFDEPSDEGDGVVPVCSAAWLAGPGVTHHYLPIGNFAPADHGKLWRGRPAHNILKRVLAGDTAAFTHVYAAVDVRAGDGDPQWIRVRIVAQDGAGCRLEGATVRIMDRAGTPLEFHEDGRLTVAIHRGRWNQVRSDLRQIRAVISWREDGFERRKSFTLMAGVSP